VKGLTSVKGWWHYFAIISRGIMTGEEERVDSAILGIDIKHDAPDTAASDDTAGNGDDIIDDDDDDDDSEMMNGDNVATVGLVLPITSSLSVAIAGQGYVIVYLNA